MSEPPPDPRPDPQPDARAADGDREPTAERPPPYQGTYGAQPGQAPPPPAPGHGAPPAPGYGPPAAAQHPGYGPPLQPHPGVTGPQDMLAGRWARLGAAILDSLILAVVSVPAILFSVRWDKMQESIESGEPIADPLDLYNVPRLMVGYAIAFAVGFAYFTVLHARSGQTIGKKALGIRVVSAADHSAVSWGQAIGRQAFVYAITIVTTALNFFVAAGALLGLLGLLDTAWILWDERRQALHDKVAGTLVVKTAPWMPNPYDKS
ncbi:RDD family protein [Actinomadura livida]|nr:MULTISPECIES: RDD family protein [Actinomadura]MBB4773233.1 putative RDD family membrane protein YckC [Actinomadura catellatispora]